MEARSALDGKSQEQKRSPLWTAKYQRRGAPSAALFAEEKTMRERSRPLSNVVRVKFESRDSARKRYATALAEDARQLDAPPKYEWHDEIDVRGEELSLPIYWIGRQWCVTAFGVEARDGTYSIAADRLDEEEAQHGWVMHMAEKEWCDLADFAEALRVARRRIKQRAKA
jgi:hypothetical protein